MFVDHVLLRRVVFLRLAHDDHHVVVEPDNRAVRIYVAVRQEDRTRHLGLPYFVEQYVLIIRSRFTAHLKSTSLFSCAIIITRSEFLRQLVFLLIMIYEIYIKRGQSLGLSPSDLDHRCNFWIEPQNAKNEDHGFSTCCISVRTKFVFLNTAYNADIC